MPNSIFESKKSQTKLRTLSLKIPPELHGEIEAIRERLNEVDPDKKFNVNAIAVSAIEKAVRRAKKELADA